MRRRLGARIGPGASIGIGTLLRAESIDIGAGARIGPLAFLRARDLVVGRQARIRPLTISKAHTIEVGDFVQIAPTVVINAPLLPQAKFSIGEHSRIFPFCWLEPGQGISIGRQVGIGGHGLIFTHGVWSDYLDGGPVSRGAVVIEDGVWLPWRVFVLPSVVIGENAVIGAGSVVNRSVPARSLAGGIPAKVIKDAAWPELSLETKVARLQEIEAAYHERRIELGLRAERAPALRAEPEGLRPGDVLVLLDDRASPSATVDQLAQGFSVLDHPRRVLHASASSAELTALIDFLRDYGIRLSLQIGVDRPQ
jgi:acetyltransferase-like isoleucine patch superfamily enzyme